MRNSSKSATAIAGRRALRGESGDDYGVLSWTKLDIAADTFALCTLKPRVAGFEGSSLFASPLRRMINNVHEILSRDPFTCTPVCRVHLRIEELNRPIGPAGDAIYVPLRITGGYVVGLGTEKYVVGGTDIAVMNADETLVHNGTCVVADPQGNTILWYDGASQAEEGAYDDLIDGTFPPKIRSRLCVRIASTNPEWQSFNRKPLLGVGSFDGNAGNLEFVILSLAELGALN